MNALEGYTEDFAELSDMYRYWKIDKFSVTAWVDITAGSGYEALYALYHQPNTAAAAPTLEVLEGKYAIGHGWCGSEAGGFAGKNAVLHLTRDDFTTVVPWFVTLNDTSGGADLDGPGEILFIQPITITNAGTVMYDITMDITFKTVLDPATISAAAEKRVLNKMEERCRVTDKKVDAYQQAPLVAAKRR